MSEECWIPSQSIRLKNMFATMTGLTGRRHIFGHIRRKFAKDSSCESYAFQHRLLLIKPLHEQLQERNKAIDARQEGMCSLMVVQTDRSNLLG